MSTNPDEERPVNIEASTLVAPQITQETMGLARASPQFFTIPQEVSNAKDSVTSRLLAREQMGVEASRSDG